MIRKFLLLTALALVFMLSACSGDPVESAASIVDSGLTGNSGSVSLSVEDALPDDEETAFIPIAFEYDDEDLDSGWRETGSTYLSLDGGSIRMDGSGAIIDDCQATITSAGIYIVEGTLDDGQIVVNVRESGTVKIVLDGANIHCSYGAPITVLNTDKAVITLAEGSSNYVSDSEEYSPGDSDDESTAAVFSKSDLTINGEGSLTVDGNYKNGIQSKDDLIITSGDITVNAVNDGLKGKDCIAIKDGNITVTAGGDGMQSTNDTGGEKGFIVLDGGKLDITAENDGIQAETGILVAGGTIDILTGGGSKNSSTGDNWGFWGDTKKDDSNIGSAKGLKAAIDITIEDGTIDIDSSDDSIHSNDNISISGGHIDISSGDDGIHADSSIGIAGGDITISKSYEGIESMVITIDDGTIHLVSSDDGINASGGVDGSSVNGRPGQNMFDYSSDCVLYLNGGYLAVDAGGDGLDINGAVYMTDGTVIVNGPVNDMNGALDYMGEFKVTGGFLVAAGSAGMAEAPSTDSSLNSIICNLSSSLEGGTLFRVENEDGDEILTFAPIKTYRSVVVCSSELNNGETYVIYTGGSDTGTTQDGVYTGGKYNPGQEVETFTISTTVTSIGTYTGGMPGGGFFPGRRR